MVTSSTPFSNCERLLQQLKSCTLIEMRLHHYNLKLRSSTEYESPLGIRGDGGNDKEAALIATKQLIILRVNNR